MSSFSRLDIVTRVLGGLIMLGATQVFVRPAGAVLVVNEVRPWSGSPGGAGEPQPAMIEFFHTGPGSESLSLHSVAGEGGVAFSFGFPAWIVPARCYLTVFLGAGTDDSDFSDSTGTHYAGEIRMGKH